MKRSVPERRKVSSSECYDYGDCELCINLRQRCCRVAKDGKRGEAGRTVNGSVIREL